MTTVTAIEIDVPDDIGKAWAELSGEQRRRASNAVARVLSDLMDRFQEPYEWRSFPEVKPPVDVELLIYTSLGLRHIAYSHQGDWRSLIDNAPYLNVTHWAYPLDRPKGVA
jgi:hypothetical protein